MSGITRIADENTFISVFTSSHCYHPSENRKNGKSIQDLCSLYIAENV